ncbi:MAG: MlaD family protein [Phycisphaerales bacterium]|nr:MlaD family protein [Phycisphaerales bacterium]
MSGRQDGNTVKAGIFVLVAVAVGVAVIFVLGDLKGVIFGPAMSSYQATFPVKQGVGFLKEGSQVRVGGIDMGEVQSVEIIAGENPIRKIDVTFTLPSSVSLYSNAVATVQSGLISSDSFVLITSVGFDTGHRVPGDLGEPGTLLASGDVLAGTPSTGMLGAILGEEAGASVQEIATRLREDGYVLEWVLGNEPARSFSAGAETVGHAMQRMDQDGYVMEWVLGDAPAEDVRSALNDLEVLAARIRTDWMGTDGQPGGWSAEISTVLSKSDDLASAVQRISDFIDRNEESFQAIVDDVEVSVADARSVLGDLRANMPLWSADVGTALANADLAAQELSLLVAEARNAPWRLLYQPSAKEVSNELLYEASRNFVFGAADLKSAADSVDRIVQARGAALDPDAADFTLLRDNLAAAVHRYERAQAQLSQVLNGSTTPAPK